MPNAAPNSYRYAGPRNNYPCADLFSRQLFRIEVRKLRSFRGMWSAYCRICDVEMCYRTFNLAVHWADTHAHGKIHKIGGVSL